MPVGMRVMRAEARETGAPAGVAAPAGSDSNRALPVTGIAHQPLPSALLYFNTTCVPRHDTAIYETMDCAETVTHACTGLLTSCLSEDSRSGKRQRCGVHVSEGLTLHRPEPRHVTDRPLCDTSLHLVK